MLAINAYKELDGQTLVGALGHWAPDNRARLSGRQYQLGSRSQQLGAEKNVKIYLYFCIEKSIFFADTLLNTI